MTKSQERAIEQLKTRVKKDLFFGDENKYEIKTWEVTENEYFVSVVFETGLIGDEGTAAAIFARDRGQVFIGKCGGITYPITKTLKNGEFKFYCKTLSKRQTVLSVVVDQK